jgi:hypothetical protein
MKVAVITLALLTILAVAESQERSTNSAMNEPTQKEKIKDPKEMYPRLRTLMLRGSRSKFSLAPTSKPTEPWGVVMDWGVKNGTATIVAMSDGSASVYFSSGGGYIGGGGRSQFASPHKAWLSVPATFSYRSSLRRSTRCLSNTGYFSIF